MKSSTRSLLIARDGIELGTLPEPEVLELLANGFFRSTDHYLDPADVEWKTLAALAQENAARNPKSDWFNQATTSFSTAASLLLNQAGAATDKLKSFVQTRRGAINEITQLVLEDYLPEIQRVAKAQLIDRPVKSLRTAVRDDELMRKVFGATHDCLPQAVKRFVSESAFIEFCLKNRNRIFETETGPAATADTKEADKPEI